MCAIAYIDWIYGHGMWNDMFTLDPSVAGKILRSVVINGVAPIVVSRSRTLRRVLVGTATPIVEAGIVNQQTLPISLSDHDGHRF
jgi:hypothetical protein